MDIGVTDILLLIIGIPYSLSICSPVVTSFSAILVILSYILSRDFFPELSAQSSRDIPAVIVRISRFSSSIILIVSIISDVLSI